MFVCGKNQRLPKLLMLKAKNLDGCLPRSTIKEWSVLVVNLSDHKICTSPRIYVLMRNGESKKSRERENKEAVMTFAEKE